MNSGETIGDYYRRYGEGCPDTGQVAAYRINGVAIPVSFPHIRRDFYKVKLLCGATGLLSYADKQVMVRNSALVFVNPIIPYSWERLTGSETGFACLFTEDFITQQLKSASLAESPLFRIGGNPVLFPNPESVQLISRLFEQLMTELQSTYINRFDLVRTYLQLIIHESLKIAPTTTDSRFSTSATRISALFLDLLNRQFPVASPHHAPLLRNANKFARQLSVHTNHLNRALKDITGKTTTEHIADKLVEEAKSLLRHSNWSVAEVGYCLGFEHQANFTIFFKKQTGYSPRHYRRRSVVVS